MGGVLAAGGDAGVDGGVVDLDVLAELDDDDALFVTEASDQPGAGAEAIGGLANGEQRAAVTRLESAASRSRYVGCCKPFPT